MNRRNLTHELNDDNMQQSRLFSYHSGSEAFYERATAHNLLSVFLLEQLHKSFSKVSSLYIQSATLPGEINLLKKMSETAA